MLTLAEVRLLELLGQVWNGYLELPVQHPHERMEFMRVVHDAQRIIAARAIIREEPSIFRIWEAGHVDI